MIVLQGALIALFAVVCVYATLVAVTYARVRGAWPAGARPTHRLFIAAGTLVVSASTTARQLTYPRWPFGLVSAVGMALLIAALGLLDRWQRRGGGW